jgi:hypothetical protein
LHVNVVDTEQQRLVECFYRLLSQYAEFIVATQPVAFLPLTAVLTRRMRGIEIPILRALLAIEVCQQDYAWIGKCFYD